MKILFLLVLTILLYFIQSSMAGNLFSHNEDTEESSWRRKKYKKRHTPASKKEKFEIESLTRGLRKLNLMKESGYRLPDICKHGDQTINIQVDPKLRNEELPLPRAEENDNTAIIEAGTSSRSRT